MKNLRGSRRGLSPLIATVVLISATIVGGMLVYNYFQKSFSSVTARSGALEISATAEYLNQSSKLVHLVIYNTYNTPINITKIKGIESSGVSTTVNLIGSESIHILIPSGGKYSTILVVPNTTVAIYVNYKIVGSGNILQSNPVSLS